MVEQLPDEMEWDYEALIPILYKKIDELVKAVNELEARIDAEGK